MRSPEIDSTQNSQIYIIACKNKYYKTYITHKYSMYYTLMIIPLGIKGNNSQFQIDKFNGLYFKTDKSQNKNRVW